VPTRDEIIRPHIPALRRYAWALSRHAHDADDLVQECLLRALGGWHLRRPEGSVRAWLFAILHNTFISTRRAAARRDQTGQDQEQPADPSQEHRLLLDEVAAALARLPDEQRAVLLLVGVEDFTYAEAARILGIPIGTVISRLSRGRERIRQLVEGAEANEPRLRRVK
jgi:RNA polymerase sigma-70 factor (ECF subfamily)